MHSRPHAGPQIYYAEQKPAVFLRKLESSSRSSAIKSVSSEGGEAVEAPDSHFAFLHFFFSRYQKSIDDDVKDES